MDTPLARSIKIPRPKPLAIAWPNVILKQLKTALWSPPPLASVRICSDHSYFKLFNRQYSN